MNLRLARLGLSTLSLGLVLGLGACVDQSGTIEDRLYDSSSQELLEVAPEHVAARGELVVHAESLSEDAAERSASYVIQTHRGKRFHATVSHRIERDGADEVITVEDLETGEVVSAAFGEESALYTGATGLSLAAGGDDENDILTFDTSVGQQTISLVGIDEGSEAEARLFELLGLLLIGETGYTQDQAQALAAAITAADEDLGGSGMGIWGKTKKALKKAAKAVGDAMCTQTAMDVCDGMYQGGMMCATTAGTLSGTVIAAPVAGGVAAACLGVVIVGAACDIGQHFGC